MINNEFGDLQEWNLSDLYKGVDDPKIEEDTKKVDELSSKFADKYKGKIAKLNASELLECLHEVDALSAVESRLGIYASLMSSKHQQKYSAFERKIMKDLTDIGTKTIFFSLELAQIPEAEVQAKIAENKGLELYRVMLEGAVKMQPHQLGEEAEMALSKKSLSGRAAWSNFFDEVDSRIRFDYKGEKLSIEEVTKLRTKADREVRKEATDALYKGLKDNLWVFTYITNTLSQDADISNDIRKFPNPIRSRNLSNNISDETVEAMNKAINNAYPRVSHRYYKLLGEILGIEKLKGYDRNAPISQKEDSSVSYADAKAMVLDSYNGFSPSMAKIAEKFFDNDWIDAPVTEGKRSGAFAMPAVRGVHPYVMLNYLGTKRDIATMAHELGHGIHQYLADNYLESQMMADTPLTVAETASVFGERVTFENLLAKEKDPEVRISMLASKINDMVNTVVRQNAFFNFEKELHATRKNKGTDLESEEINAIYMKTQTEALGPAFDLDEDYGLEWAYIPHFIHSPYYVYAYAFGECLVNSLYQKYIEANDKQDFVRKYMHMLELGGSKSPNEMVKEFGLDLEDSSFWDGGMKAIEDLIDKLEEEINNK